MCAFFFSSFLPPLSLLAEFFASSLKKIEPSFETAENPLGGFARRLEGEWGGGGEGEGRGVGGVEGRRGLFRKKGGGIFYKGALLQKAKHVKFVYY